MRNVRSSARRIILQQVKILEADVEPLADLRELVKTSGGRLTEDGRKFIQFAKQRGWKQSTVARIMGITAGAVSQHYNK